MLLGVWRTIWHAIQVSWANSHKAVSSSERDTTRVFEHRQLLAAVLDAAASLILVMDAEGRLVRWNRACEELLGYRQAELEAPFALLELLPVGERKAAETCVRALLGGESPLSAEFHWRTRRGDLRLIEWSLTALRDSHGEITHMVGTGNDVTEARRWAEERMEGEARLRHMADHDALTGLFNRRRFEEELHRHMAQGRRYGMSGALLLLDLDDFKQVNDTHGHGMGDSVLTAVAMVLRRRLRESDILARFGGDEFAVLMPVGGAPRARELAGLLATAVRTDVATPAGRLSASVGIAVLDESSTPDELLSSADDAMYAMKGSKRAVVRHLRPVE